MLTHKLPQRVLPLFLSNSIFPECPDLFPAILPSWLFSQARIRIYMGCPLRRWAVAHTPIARMRPASRVTRLTPSVLAERPFINKPDTGPVIDEVQIGSLPLLADLVALPDFEAAAQHYLPTRNHSYYHTGSVGEYCKWPHSLIPPVYRIPGANGDNVLKHTVAPSKSSPKSSGHGCFVICATSPSPQVSWTTTSLHPSSLRPRPTPG